MTRRDRPDRDDLPFDGLWLVLRLLEDLDDAGPAGELLLRGLVELRPELGERLKRSELRQVEPEP
jgi:hypothetical protein